MGTPKTLVIGSLGHQHVKCVDWKDISTVNIVDFDLVIVNTRPLALEFLQNCDVKFFDDVRSKLSRLLLSSGSIIVLGDRFHYHRFSEWTSHSNYSWSPVKIWTANESGDTVVIETTEFSKYTEKIKSWSFLYEFPSGTDDLTDELQRVCGKHSSQYEYHFDVNRLVGNRYGKILAGTIILRTTFKIDKYSDRKARLTLGPLSFFPLVDGMDPRQAVNIFLEEALSLPQETLPPQWVDNIPMPFIAGIQKQIDEKKGSIGIIETEISNHLLEKSNLEKYKLLLYGSGFDLEQIFSQCIEKLGAKVIPAKYSDEEFIIEYRSEEYLVECKGIGKSVARSHVVQLLGYIAKYEEETGKTGKGILFGNAWKEIPVAERDQPFFPDNVIASAKSNDIALVSSVSFFHVFCKFLAGEIAGEKILDAIVNSSGVVEF